MLFVHMWTYEDSYHLGYDILLNVGEYVQHNTSRRTPEDADVHQRHHVPQIPRSGRQATVHAACRPSMISKTLRETALVLASYPE